MKTMLMVAAGVAVGLTMAIAVLIQAYFVGLLANLLPLPGGIGGVDGGMIGALAMMCVMVMLLRIFRPRG